MTTSRTTGFTLIEVLVALAIASLGLAAVLSVVTNSARDASAMRTRTFAGWIALNRLTTLRLAPALPSVERSAGDIDYAAEHWAWEQTVTQTDVAGIRRVDVAVRLKQDGKDSARATVTGFVGRVQVTTVPSTTPWEGTPSGPGTGGR